MPNCQQYQDRVDALQQQFEEQKQECDQLEGTFQELKMCRQQQKDIEEQLNRARTALQNCLAGLPSPGVRRAEGHLTFLRVVDGGGFGPPEDFLDVEVIFGLDTQPERAFGFQLRDNEARPSHEGMLLLLRDAFVHSFDVAIDYRQVLNKANSVAFRVEVTNPRRDGRIPAPLIPVP